MSDIDFSWLSGRQTLTFNFHLPSPNNYYGYEFYFKIDDISL